MVDQHILCHVSEHIATITLNRPERLNAYTPAMGQGLAAAFARYDDDDDVRVIVVTGAGRGFCAGADLGGDGAAFTQAGRAERQREVRVQRAAGVRPWEITKPIIAAINGPAVGVGITMTLQWDIRIAAEGAKIAFAFVRRGVIPEALSTWILPRLIGLSRAAELLYSGRTISAREALEYGILSRVVPDAELSSTVHALAADIVRNAAPVPVAITKRLLWHHLSEVDMQHAEDVETRLFGWAGMQPDAREGVRAFLEKRAPQWRSKPSTELPDFLPSRRRR